MEALPGGQLLAQRGRQVGPVFRKQYTGEAGRLENTYQGAQAAGGDPAGCVGRAVVTGMGLPRSAGSAEDRPPPSPVGQAEGTQPPGMVIGG